MTMLLLDSDWTKCEYPDRHMNRGTREQMGFIMRNISALVVGRNSLQVYRILWPQFHLNFKVN